MNNKKLYQKDLFNSEKEYPVKNVFELIIKDSEIWDIINSYIEDDFTNISYFIERLNKDYTQYTYFDERDKRDIYDFLYDSLSDYFYNEYDNEYYDKIFKNEYSTEELLKLAEKEGLKLICYSWYFDNYNGYFHYTDDEEENNLILLVTADDYKVVLEELEIYLKGIEITSRSRPIEIIIKDMGTGEIVENYITITDTYNGEQLKEFFCSDAEKVTIIE